jgi:hypothetical protein
MRKSITALSRRYFFVPKAHCLCLQRPWASSQALCETAITLQRLAGASPQLASLLSQLKPASDEATESLACGQHVRQQLGQSTEGVDAERAACRSRGTQPTKA